MKFLSKKLTGKKKKQYRHQKPNQRTSPHIFIENFRLKRLLERKI